MGDRDMDCGGGNPLLGRCQYSRHSTRAIKADLFKSVDFIIVLKCVHASTLKVERKCNCQLPYSSFMYSMLYFCLRFLLWKRPESDRHSLDWIQLESPSFRSIKYGRLCPRDSTPVFLTLSVFASALLLACCDPVRPGSSASLLRLVLQIGHPLCIALRVIFV